MQRGGDDPTQVFKPVDTGGEAPEMRQVTTSPMVPCPHMASTRTLLKKMTPAVQVVSAGGPGGRRRE